MGSGVSANSGAVSDADEMLLHPGAHTRPDVKSGASEQTEYQDPGRSRLRRVQGTDMTERHVSLEPDENNSGRQSSNSSVAAWTHFIDESQANDNNNNDRGSSRVSSIVAAVAAAAAATVALPAHHECGMVCIQMLHAFLDTLWCVFADVEEKYS
ncbi:unnamed protein product [Dibothriocephalus latus]|uniref:Uncharacterized protein n=1 Tax=Dibothriocephalus latus TaxID=60516 RepID=A0A3P7N8V7_DIBLA|nr:unnamed protein product [Dibothriocephalus latus]